MNVLRPVVLWTTCDTSLVPWTGLLPARVETTGQRAYFSVEKFCWRLFNLASLNISKKVKFAKYKGFTVSSRCRCLVIVFVRFFLMLNVLWSYILDLSGIFTWLLTGCNMVGGWMDERCFRPLLRTVKAELGRGQPGLIRWIWDETLPPEQYRSLDLLLCNSPRYRVS